jgi:transcriptional regulator with XRE-family HTH domain
MGDAGGGEWARWLKAMTDRPGWSVARLAREAGVHRSTIHRWMSDGGDAVTIGMIRMVAGALGERLEVALRAAADLPPAADAAVDEELELIRQAPVDPDTKIALIRRWLERRDREQAARVEDLRTILSIERR